MHNRAIPIRKRMIVNILPRASLGCQPRMENDSIRIPFQNLINPLVRVLVLQEDLSRLVVLDVVQSASCKCRDPSRIIPPSLDGEEEGLDLALSYWFVAEAMDSRNSADGTPPIMLVNINVSIPVPRQFE